MATSSSVRVVVRVRPMLSRELEFDNAVEALSGREIVLFKRDQEFASEYDAILGEHSTQEDVYGQVRGGIISSLAGYNNTIFAYGQTGTGKTHTMMGNHGVDITDTSDAVELQHCGIIPRAVKDLFHESKQLTLREGAVVSIAASYMEIYNDRLYDLLQPYKKKSNRDPLDVQKHKELLEVREDPYGATHVPNLLYVKVKNNQSVLQLIAKGNKNRAVRHTDMNLSSSRSHAILQLIIEQWPGGGTQGRMIRSKVNFVDLAGSERWNMRAEMNADHVSELTAINSSLSALANVVSALTERKQHVPYRNSKLTHLLQDSLGGNCCTTIIATISPSVDAFEESCSTLKFADRVSCIDNNPIVNTSRDMESVLAIKEKEIQRLRQMVTKMASGSVADGQLPEAKEELEELRKLLEMERALRTDLEQKLQAAFTGMLPVIHSISGIDTSPSHTSGSNSFLMNDNSNSLPQIPSPGSRPPNTVYGFGANQSSTRNGSPPHPNDGGQLHLREGAPDLQLNGSAPLSAHHHHHHETLTSSESASFLSKAPQGPRGAVASAEQIRGGPPRAGHSGGSAVAAGGSHMEAAYTASPGMRGGHSAPMSYQELLNARQQHATSPLRHANSSPLRYPSSGGAYNNKGRAFSRGHLPSPSAGKGEAPHVYRQGPPSVAYKGGYSVEKVLAGMTSSLAPTKAGTAAPNLAGGGSLESAIQALRSQVQQLTLLEHATAQQQARLAGSQISSTMLRNPAKDHALSAFYNGTGTGGAGAGGGGKKKKSRQKKLPPTSPNAILQHASSTQLLPQSHSKSSPTLVDPALLQIQQKRNLQQQQGLGSSTTSNIDATASPFRLQQDTSSSGNSSSSSSRAAPQGRGHSSSDKEIAFTEAPPLLITEIEEHYSTVEKGGVKVTHKGEQKSPKAKPPKKPPPKVEASSEEESSGDDEETDSEEDDDDEETDSEGASSDDENEEEDEDSEEEEEEVAAVAATKKAKRAEGSKGTDSRPLNGQKGEESSPAATHSAVPLLPQITATATATDPVPPPLPSSSESLASTPPIVQGWGRSAILRQAAAAASSPESPSQRQHLVNELLAEAVGVKAKDKQPIRFAPPSTATSFTTTTFSNGAYHAHSNGNSAQHSAASSLKPRSRDPKLDQGSMIFVLGANASSVKAKALSRSILRRRNVLED